MDARYYVTLEKFVKAGDRAVVYTSGGNFRAVIEFIGQYFYSEDDLGWTKKKDKFLFPYRIKFRLIHEAAEPLKISFSTEDIGNKAECSRPNFIDDIVFIADKGKTWNQYFQVSIINITKDNFDTLSKAIMSRKAIK